MSLGERPEGVDWKDREAQDDRLRALALLVQHDKKPYSLNDWGCGYGRALNWFSPSAYYGYDLNQWCDSTIIAAAPTHVADYTIASGIFNVKGDGDWPQYVLDCIETMERKSIRGYGFNLLHDRCDRRDDALFYASMDWLQPFIKGKRISILQHYSPWDFTVLVHLC